VLANAQWVSEPWPLGYGRGMRVCQGCARGVPGGCRGLPEGVPLPATVVDATEGCASSVLVLLCPCLTVSLVSGVLVLLCHCLTVPGPPPGKGSLYIRPLLIASPVLGLAAAPEYSFIVYVCPVGNYFTGAIDLKVEEEYHRAARGDRRS